MTAIITAPQNKPTRNANGAIWQPSSGFSPGNTQKATAYIAAIKGTAMIANRRANRKRSQGVLFLRVTVDFDVCGIQLDQEKVLGIHMTVLGQ
jgi:hypothetical protein